MIMQTVTQSLKHFSFFKGLEDAELEQIAGLSGKRSYATGELCQIEGESANCIHIITEGRVGTLVRIPNVTYCSSEIILDTLHAGDLFGWSALIRGSPWSTLRVLEPTEVIYINADDLLGLCENYPRIGYILMKNLACLVASRLRKNRVSTLRAIVAIKGEG
jgi:CRP/FNR family transcriptional regulator, cyclic AMP receptor protein